MIDDHGDPANPDGDVHVRVGADHYNRLLALKLFRGQSFAETIRVALDLYFEHVAAED